MAEYTIYVTAKNGDGAAITGTLSCIESIEKALFLSGARFDRVSETWDFGYYSDANYDMERGK